MKKKEKKEMPGLFAWDLLHAIQHSKTLSKEERGKVMAEVLKMTRDERYAREVGFRVLCLTAEHKTVTGTLCNAFSWNKTDERSGFWFEIYCKLRG